MKKQIENYVLGKSVGAGSYGKVHISENIKTHETVAIKIIPNRMFYKSKNLDKFVKNEINSLKKTNLVKNPNIIKFIEILRSSNNTYFIYEYCNGGTLEQMMKKKKRYKEREALKIFAQLLTAMKTLVTMDIIHRDVKPENILFHDDVIKLGDFGFCTKLAKGRKERTRVGSPIYMAPEILFDKPYDNRCDIYSLGVLLYEMLFARAPYESNSLPDLKMQINRGRYRFPAYQNKISKSTENLIRRLL